MPAVRILLAHRYYWPDVVHYAHMLRAIGERAAADGHDVTVVTAQPAYNEVSDTRAPRRETVAGVRVRRVRLLRERKKAYGLRLLNSLAFALAVAGHVVRHRRRYDLLMVATTPPVLVGLAARVASRLTGMPFIYHCQDIHPEIDVLAGIMAEGRLFRLLRRLDARTCRAAATVIALSPDMAELIAERTGGSARTEIINNFIITERPAEIPAPLRRRPGEYQVLFAGNMGHYQGLHHVIEAARRLADLPGLRFVFMGAGAAVDDLRQQAGDLLGSTIRFYPHQPVEVALAVMGESQLGLVSLEPGIHRTAYPSKTTMLLAAGCRVLAVVEEESSLARMVEAADLGVTSPPGSVDGLVSAVRKEVEQYPDGHDRDRISAFATEQFGRQRVLARWSALFAGWDSP